MTTMRTTARITGALYLGIALSGAIGFLLIRPRLYAVGDPATTAANLVAQEPLARVGIALELALVLTQALAAVWFYRLFRTVDAFAAGCIAAFGLVNAVAILGSATLLTSALTVALDPVADAATAPHLMYVVGDGVWAVTNLFFGLWLIPMGYCALRAGMPRPLGWILMGGGVGYVVNAFVMCAVPNALPDSLLALPATVGELWMVGYLLAGGVNRRASAPATAAGR
jgi:hypothetical protein